MSETYITPPEIAPIEVKKGQYWEFDCKVRGPVEYVVIHVERPGVKGRLVRLANTDTERIAYITVRWLLEGKSAYPRSTWRLLT